MYTKITVVAVLVAVASSLVTVAAVSPATAPAAAGEPFPDYQVSGGDSAVLVQTSSGKTWALVATPDGKHHAWMPITRVDTNAEAAKWWITVKER